MINYCVQCNEEIQPLLDYEAIYFCDNPKCPNYGLLQLGSNLSDMDEEPDYDN